MACGGLRQGRARVSGASGEGNEAMVQRRKNELKIRFKKTLIPFNKCEGVWRGETVLFFSMELGTREMKACFFVSYAGML